EVGIDAGPQRRWICGCAFRWARVKEAGIPVWQRDWHDVDYVLKEADSIRGCVILYEQLRPPLGRVRGEIILLIQQYGIGRKVEKLDGAMPNHGDAMGQEETPVVAPEPLAVGAKSVEQLTRSLKAERASLQIFWQHFGIFGGASAGEPDADSSRR